MSEDQAEALANISDDVDGHEEEGGTAPGADEQPAAAHDTLAVEDVTTGGVEGQGGMGNGVDGNMPEREMPPA
jgi:hypothetical protein